MPGEGQATARGQVCTDPRGRVPRRPADAPSGCLERAQEDTEQVTVLTTASCVQGDVEGGAAALAQTLAGKGAAGLRTPGSADPFFMLRGLWGDQESK